MQEHEARGFDGVTQESQGPWQVLLKEAGLVRNEQPLKDEAYAITPAFREGQVKAKLFIRGEITILAKQQ